MLHTLPRTRACTFSLRKPAHFISSSVRIQRSHGGDNSRGAQLLDQFGGLCEAWQRCFDKGNQGRPASRKRRGGLPPSRLHPTPFSPAVAFALSAIQRGRPRCFVTQCPLVPGGDLVFGLSFQEGRSSEDLRRRAWVVAGSLPTSGAEIVQDTAHSDCLETWHSLALCCFPAQPRKCSHEDDPEPNAHLLASAGTCRGAASKSRGGPSGYTQPVSSWSSYNCRRNS